MKSTDEPLISVVMATYNTEYPMIREAIESLINQTYTNWELILIDDCSTKYNNFSFLDEYDDSRIKLFHNDENLGCTKCFNKGIRLAQGKYIARLDADDIALPRRFTTQVQYMQEHSETKVVSSRIKFFEGKDGVGLYVPWNPEYIRTSLLLTNGICHSSLMFRRELFMEDCLCYDESFRYAQDYDLLVRVIELGYYIVQLPECLVYIRVHNNQISTVNSKSSFEQKAFMSSVSEKQLRQYFRIPKKDVVYRDALVNASLEQLGVSTDSINEWVLNILKNNKKTRCFNQHYLRLVFAERYAYFMRITRDSSCLGFVIHRMGLELIQSFFIFCYRRTLKHVYRMKYGSTGTKG